MRPIDADALKERLTQTNTDNGNTIKTGWSGVNINAPAVVMTLLGIFDIIDAEPTIEVADVTGKEVNKDR